jgi:hypothetical protein
MWGEDNAGKKLMPTQLFLDIMHMIKNVYFCVKKCKVDNPIGKFIILGTDHLEELFGILQTMVGTDSNLDLLQLSLCLTGTTEVSKNTLNGIVDLADSIFLLCQKMD